MKTLMVWITGYAERMPFDRIPCNSYIWRGKIRPRQCWKDNIIEDITSKGSNRLDKWLNDSCNYLYLSAPTGWHQELMMIMMISAELLIRTTVQLGLTTGQSESVYCCCTAVDRWTSKCSMLSMQIENCSFWPCWSQEHLWVDSLKRCCINPWMNEWMNAYTHLAMLSGPVVISYSHNRLMHLWDMHIPGVVFHWNPSQIESSTNGLHKCTSSSYACKWHLLFCVRCSCLYLFQYYCWLNDERDCTHWVAERRASSLACWLSANLLMVFLSTCDDGLIRLAYSSSCS